MQTDNKAKDISVVILCYKAGEEVGAFVDEVRQSLTHRELSYELVLVANYNANEKDTDKTPAIVKRIAERDLNITVVSKVKEGGMGWDLRSGLLVASGKTIAYIDGDGQMPADDIVRVYDSLISGPYDCAKTYRTKRGDGRKRGFISFIYNTLLMVLFPKVSVGDANAKPKIFTRKAFQKLRLTSPGWFIDAEIIIQGSYLGFQFVEIPTVFRENKYRKSFVRPSAIFEFLWNLILFRLTRMHEFKQ
ncbi:MAG: hypothetical protein A2942_00330 [Candidatus Lloydbacteria bacterium RIFCSPLOWO2_01_FULL_50_20]|uniref:Glycosyltransferase 2-like domain-containing protein n=1 Tax=Candidatus Lloydbacteria bacterium RIFCSPLOWO2_01_FULL_50_20 TaxID=1798665 RepID=A0A1G2DFY5_9BACT|nr:MAG: hypothetical protein A3C13_04200 [Candidatus Lloydbacteria bacterium RIFCSPHIGHO2_02_FULL_50_11]OGZ12545.1 MAG: hypothetical protein A2942_00330 [Candidatus Lloydbacteria bacterium RIFCSPLOWO2_01_FULL_50_20]